MSETSGGGSGQGVVGQTSSERSNIAIRIPNGTPERTFNGFTLNRMVRILRSGGTQGKVSPGSEEQNLQNNVVPQALATMPSEPNQGEQVGGSTMQVGGSTRFATMVRRYITHRRVSKKCNRIILFCFYT